MDFISFFLPFSTAYLVCDVTTSYNSISWSVIQKESVIRFFMLRQIKKTRSQYIFSPP
jgi:hypothetical protein